MVPYSVLISVYDKEQPSFLRQALDSMYAQTVPPDEVVLVCDGPLTPELDQCIDSFQNQYGERLRVLRLEQNVGLGNALNQGLQLCSNEWIARMDSDDLSVPDRMEKQLAYVENHPEVSVVGGQILEFSEDPKCPEGVREVPLELEQIRQTLPFRNPMNHVTVLYRKSAVLSVGNYENYPGFEDYQLWARMIGAGCRMANLPDCLCQVRTGLDMYRRRGGWAYFRNTYRMQCFLIQQKQITRFQFVRNLVVRFAASVLMPGSMRSRLFRKMMRKQVPQEPKERTP